MTSQAIPVPIGGARTNVSAGATGSLSPLAKSPPHNPSTIEYASSAPLPAFSPKHTDDEALPAHLYEKLPPHYLEASPRGDVPDYLRMILMCAYIRPRHVLTPQPRCTLPRSTSRRLRSHMRSTSPSVLGATSGSSARTSSPSSRSRSVERTT